MSVHSISLAPALPAAKPRDTAKTGPRGFARGTLIRTLFGLRPVERLMAGDLLLDAQGRIIVLRAVRQVRAEARDLVRIDPSALGLGCAPGRLDRALVVGAGQELAMRDWRSEILFSKPVMTRAAKLVDGQHVHRHDSALTLHELTLDQNAVIEADGLKTLLRSDTQIAQDGGQQIGQIIGNQPRTKGARRLDMQ